MAIPSRNIENNNWVASENHPHRYASHFHIIKLQKPTMKWNVLRLVCSHSTVLCFPHHESYQTFSITAKALFLGCPEPLSCRLTSQQQSGNWLVPPTDGKQEKLFVVIVRRAACQCFSPFFYFDFMCVTFTPTSSEYWGQTPDCWCLKQSATLFSRLNLGDNSHSSEMFCDEEKPETCEILQASHKLL